jgi:hypothetical protein
MEATMQTQVAPPCCDWKGYRSGGHQTGRDQIAGNKMPSRNCRVGAFQSPAFCAARFYRLVAAPSKPCKVRLL